MRERKSLSSRRTAAAAGRTGPVRSKHDYSKELMELAVEAANSRVLPEFLRGFAERTAEMLQASWAAVAEITGNRVEVYSRKADFPANIAPSTPNTFQIRRTLPYTTTVNRPCMLSGAFFIALPLI